MAELLNANDKRTAYCAELSAEDIGKRVCVMGWVQKQRDLGALIFIDLRDRTGIVQLAFDDKTAKDIFDMAFGIRAEYTLCAKPCPSACRIGMGAELLYYVRRTEPYDPV